MVEPLMFSHISMRYGGPPMFEYMRLDSWSRMQIFIAWRHGNCRCQGYHPSMGITPPKYERIHPPSKPPLFEADRAIAWVIITNLIAPQLGCVRTTRTSAPPLGWLMTTRMYAPPLGRGMTRISLQGWLKPYHYIQDDANVLDECRGMVEWCEVGTASSRGGVLLLLRSRPALVMQLVGGWPDGPRICPYMPHILYLVAKLFEQCSSLLVIHWCYPSLTLLSSTLSGPIWWSRWYILRTTYIRPDNC